MLSVHEFLSFREHLLKGWMPSAACLLLSLFCSSLFVGNFVTLTGFVWAGAPKHLSVTPSMPLG